MNLSTVASTCSEITVILAALAMLIKPIRNKLLGLDKLTDAAGRHIPMGKPYAVAVKSSVPVLCQYSRLDTTQVNMSLMTTIAAR